jgi:hypothetical protein
MLKAEKPLQSINKAVLIGRFIANNERVQKRCRTSRTKNNAILMFKNDIATIDSFIALNTG